MTKVVYGCLSATAMPQCRNAAMPQCRNAAMPHCRNQGSVPATTPNATKDTRSKLTKPDVQGLAGIIRRCVRKSYANGKSVKLYLLLVVCCCGILLSTFVLIFFGLGFRCGTCGDELFENFEVSENRSFDDDL